MSLKELMSGYGGFAFPLPAIAGSCKGRNLIVCGDAACIWDDLERFGARDDSGPRGRVRKDGWDVMVINKLGETFPGWIHHWYSNEPHLLHKFIAARRNEYEREFSKEWKTHSCNVGADYRWPWGGHGTSGLGAVLVGLGLGYEPPIVLCGIPLDDGPHNGEPPWRRTGFASSETAPGPNGRNSHWQRAIKLGFDGRIRSMSGRTREWLGEP